MGWQERSSLIIAYDNAAVGSALRGMYSIIGDNEELERQPVPVGVVPAIVRVPDSSGERRAAEAFASFFKHQYGIGMDGEHWLKTAEPLPDDLFGRTWNWWVEDASSTLGRHGLGESAYATLESQILLSSFIPAMVLQTWCGSCVRRGSWALVSTRVLYSPVHGAGRRWAPVPPSDAERRIAEENHEIDEDALYGMVQDIFMEHHVDKGLDDDQKLLQWQSLVDDDPDTEYALYEEAAANLRMEISSAHGALWDPPDWLLKSVEEEFAFLFDYINRILCPLSMDRQRMFYDAVSEGVGMFNDAVGLEMEMRQSNGAVAA